MLYVQLGTDTCSTSLNVIYTFSIPVVLTGYRDYNLNPEDVVTIPNWISVNGWKYMPGSVVVLKYSNETTSGHPKFGKVEKIVLSNENRR